MNFNLITTLSPKGDQGNAIARLTENIKKNGSHHVLWGVTGSGKTFIAANVIEKINYPTLIISHNKMLAWQLYQEFKEFFPKNEVHYFVSYYDYYQPEAYIPQTDTYISKDASINKKIDAMRHSAVQALNTKKDVLVVASVSCIYNIGSPETYRDVSLKIKEGQNFTRKEFLKTLVHLGFQRNDFAPEAGNFRAKGSRIEIHPATGEKNIIVELNTHGIYKISRDSTSENLTSVKIFPANFWVAPENRLKIAISAIKLELRNQLDELKKLNKNIEAYRLEQKTNYDLELMEQMGYCPGIENYSRHLDFREPGEAPFTLLDYFPKDFLTIIDESHMTIPQIRGMYAGDRARKINLITHGFRLPSAIDNRPLAFNEFTKRIGQTIYMSATPGEYELQKASTGDFQINSKSQIKKFKQNLIPKTYNLKPNIVEQMVRPTGLLDPKIEVRKTKNQMENALREIKKVVAMGQRVLVVTITKRLSEDIAEYMQAEGIKINYIHSEIHTLDRPIIIKKLREGVYDVLVGINLLREGLDLPEVSLVIIFDADKEGFLRNETTLLQTIGRAARHIDGKAILYADKITKSIKATINETNRRRKIQEKYNKDNNITPRSITKKIFQMPEEIFKEEDDKIIEEYKNMAKTELEKEMKKAVKELNFEKAAKLRDEIRKLYNGGDGD